MPRQDEVKIGEILANEDIISPKQLEEFLEEQNTTGRSIIEIISDHGIAKEDAMVQTISSRLGYACIDLSMVTVEPEVVELVPKDICRKFSAVPLYVLHNTLTLAMTDPLDTEAVNEFKSKTGLDIHRACATHSTIESIINKYYDSGEDQPADSLEGEMFVSNDVVEKGEGENTTGPVASTDQVTSLTEAASRAPVVKMVNEIIAQAVEMNASDIHLEPQRTELSYRFRIDGILHPISVIHAKHQAAVISKIKIMANMDIAEKRLPQDGRVHMFVADREVDLRVSTFPTMYGENLIIRILDRSTGILSLEQLGFPADIRKQFSALIKRPYGIILVTGPTGSGKTTTLYGALSEINTTDKNIITLEDPIEYEIQGVRQSQVNVKAGLTFASGLRSIVRQDPDVIMIGEIRDKETADIAIQAALTGHLVFSTLHTNDAPSAITRLIDMGIESFLISSSIIGILAQRLVRLVCEFCKEEYTPSKELMTELGIDNQKSSPKKLKFYKESGCVKCKNRGYSGRSGIFELLITNDTIKDLIAKKASATVIRDEVTKEGMKTLRESGLQQVIAGHTSVTELLRITEEK